MTYSDIKRRVLESARRAQYGNVNDTRNRGSTWRRDMGGIKDTLPQCNIKKVDVEFSVKINPEP